MFTPERRLPRPGQCGHSPQVNPSVFFWCRWFWVCCVCVACLLFSQVSSRWYAPSPRHLRSLLSDGGWFFVWSFVVFFLSCRVFGVVLVVCLCDLFLFLHVKLVVLIVCLCGWRVCSSYRWSLLFLLCVCVGDVFALFTGVVCVTCFSFDRWSSRVWPTSELAESWSFWL